MYLKSSNIENSSDENEIRLKLNSDSFKWSKLI
jgi:hypothetical protein